MNMNEIAMTLQQLGMLEHEARTLAALLERHDATAQDVADAVGIPYTKIYGILQSLEKQGFLKTTLERPKKYRPINPDAIVDIILKKRKEEFELMERLAKEKHNILSKTYNSGTAYRGTERVWFLPTQEAVWDTVEDFISTPKECVRTIADEWIWKNVIKKERLSEKAIGVMEKGIIFKSIAPNNMGIDFNELSKNWISFFAHKNSFTRFVDKEKIHHNVLIKDEEKAGFSLKGIEGGEICSGAVVIDESFIKGMIDYFNSLWDMADPVEDQIRLMARAALKLREKH